MPHDQVARFHEAEKELAAARNQRNDPDQKSARKLAAKEKLAAVERQRANNTLRLSQQLEELTGLESRVTILGYVQRGGTPSSADRILATRLGTACADFIRQGKSNVLVAARSESTIPVPLEEITGRRKVVPVDHPWVQAARDIGVCLGDA